MLRRRDGVAAGRVHDHDAPLRGGLDVDVVDADAGAPDDLQPGRRRQGLRGHLGLAPDDQRVEFADPRDQLVLLETSARLHLKMGTLCEDCDAFR